MSSATRGSASRAAAGDVVTQEVRQPRAAVHVRVTGVVQGVGFRPFVHRCAIRLHLAGWVRNRTEAVEMHVEGQAYSVGAFLAGLRLDAPALARIESLTVTAVPFTGFRAFEVRASSGEHTGRLPISPDVAMCDTCESELLDPSNRRFRYPFITCTDCGPRFTVVEQMPYDRERTSMRAFEQCPACLHEYRTPGDRRYHSETNSCELCGPRLWFQSHDGRVVDAGAESAIAAASAVLRGGGIVAVRGLGGFHLAADATSETAVHRLRSRKRRDAKPLAVMVRSVEEARVHARVDDGEERELRSPARPIVLLLRHGVMAKLPDSIAPGLDRIGIMLAYTPLHRLLLDATDGPLVMTSGNVSDEPIAIDNDEARERLAEIADAFLLHDREIVARYDDSVLRMVDGAPVFLRRARGYAPSPVDLPIASPRPLLAVGPHLKNTFTLLEGRRAFPSQHIGDLDNVETVEHWRAALERFRTLFHIEPEMLVHDLHPGYLSTRLALESGLGVVIAAVQHHHAHIAAVMAEHGRTAPVIGVAFDGTGYGADGAVWGSEILYADLAGYRRLGHLRYAPLPGGDAAARAPWRTAVGYLAHEPGEIAAFAQTLEGEARRSLDLVLRQLERNLNAPHASSMGRLFDAAAAVIGARHVSHYEGQAAMELESLAGDRPGEVLPYCLTTRPDGTLELDAVPLLVSLLEQARAGRDSRDLAASFHETVVGATTELVRRAVSVTGCDTVALGGGCFQNARLLAGVVSGLKTIGLRVLRPYALSPNDGAVSLGQAAVGAATLARIDSQVDRVAQGAGG